MSKSRLPIRSASPSPALPQQMLIAFDSMRLRGLSAAERMKVLTHLSYLLMLAAGVASKEDNDER